MDLADDIFSDVFPEMEVDCASAFHHKKRDEMWSASKLFEEALRSGIKLPSDEVVILYELATLDIFSADFELGLSRYEDALLKAREVQNPYLECAVLFGCGHCYNSLKRHADATRSFQALGDIANVLGNDLFQVVSHCCLAKNYFDEKLNWVDNAAKQIDFAEIILKNTSHDSKSRPIMALLCARGRLHLAKGSTDLALQAQHLETARKYLDFETHLSTHLTNNDRAKLFSCQAVIYSLMSSYTTALKFAQQALDVAEGYSAVGESNAVLSSIHFKLNSSENGFRCGDAALASFRRADNNMRDFEVSLQIVNSYLSFKGFDPTQMFQLTMDEVSKLSARYVMPATTFIKTLQMRLTSDVHKLAFAELSNELSELIQLMFVNIDDLNTALGCAESTRTMSLISGMERRFKDTSSDFDILQLLESSIASPGMLKVVSSCSDNAVFFSFMRNRFFEGFVAWIFKANQAVDYHNFTKYISTKVIPCSNQVLEDTITMLQRNIATMSREAGVASRDARFDERNALKEEDLEIGERYRRGSADILQELYRILFLPIENELPVLRSYSSTSEIIYKRLLIIPNAHLLLLPFPALMNEKGHHLCDFVNVTVAPSLKLLAHLNDLAQLNRGPSRFLVIGNPLTPPGARLCTLPGAEREARNVAALFPDTELLIGKSARKYYVMEKMVSAEVIHFACHGSWSENFLALASNNPSYDSQNVTPRNADYRLTADEVAQLPLTARLVVLSACNSGRGKVTGEGIIGLARSFIAAGARAVLVALWQLPDDATELIMTTFYSKFKAGESASSALRLAMEDGRQRKRNPFYWAAFYLIGVDVHYSGAVSEKIQMYMYESD